MSEYELISIVVSCLSAGISLVVWSGQRRLTRESNDLQRATAELAKKQLEILLADEKGHNKARLTLRLEKEGRTSFKFYVTNISDYDARNVELEIVVPEGTTSPIIPMEYDGKFPARVIPPGSSISLNAALTMGSPLAYNARLRWTNPGGDETEEETYVAL